MLELYDTLSDKKKPFVALHGNRVNMFVCGLTPYDSPHIGHARAYIFFDMLARYLKYKGYSVFYLQNVTDIDDKIINRAGELKVKPGELAAKYFQEYLEVMGILKVNSVTLYAKATDYIDEIIDQVKTLVKKGHGYESHGSVYFRVSSYKRFGELSGQILDNLQEGARLEIDPNKENPEDFALWKAFREGEPYWHSPWGDGRPGWHIEDTAIAMNYFGARYDIHGGGTDLIFPHHEAEIAQAESVTDIHPYVNYWVHTGMLNVKGEKMSKSLHNFITIRDLLGKYTPEQIRFFMLNTDHLKPLDFSYEALNESCVSHEKLVRFYNAVGSIGFNSPYEEDLQREIAYMKERFFESTDSDLSTREAFAVIFSAMGEINRFIATGRGSRDQYGSIAAFLNAVNAITAVFAPKQQVNGESAISNLVESMIAYRNELRNSKRFGESDEIRALLEKAGIVIEDSKNGTTWYRKE